MPEHRHTPVLAPEAIRALAPRPGDVAVDCTVGRGGHARLLAQAVRGGGRIVGFDLDEGNLARGRTCVEALGVPFLGFHDSFARAAERLAGHGLRAAVVLADLGISSSQLDERDRGFSFQVDGPLDMRYDRSGAAAPGRAVRPGAATAAELLASLDEDELARIISEYGEEPLAQKIARKLVQTRERKPIERTSELSAVVLEAYGGRARSARMHPATRTFMALRIAVNEELDALGMLLASVARGALSPGGSAADRSAGGTDWLSEGARVAIISFHSLEDRLVKRAFTDLRRRGLARAITRGPVRAAAQEVGENPRARSAKLRAVELGGAIGGGRTLE